MPWKIRREIYLILLGVIALALSVVVWVLNQNASSDLLAAIGVVGGLAIVVNTLPANGNGDRHREG